MPRCLARLELQGYKTFVSKTDFEFGDVTCIVGPNGSGKSNIADALRWVLGEQSYQLLRGRKTEDMIFSGSEKRPKASMAAVTVVFDNSNGWLPIEFSEVDLTRRAYRDGSNEYLLNGQKARLRDIADLLGKVGLARRTYTIIGQGLVDAALSLKADERRALFEEAAGIGTYRQKRDESLRKLDATQRNLDRAQDIMAEIRPRLRALERQAKRAGEHRQDMAHFQGKLCLWYGYHWHHIQDLLGVARSETDTQSTALAELRARQVRKDEHLSQLRAEISVQRAKLESKLGEAASKRDELEGVRRQLAVAEERSRNLTKHKQATSTQLDQFESILTDQRERLAEVRGEVSRLENECSELQDQISDAEDQVEQWETERRSVVAREAGFRNRAADITQQITESHARLTALQDRMEQLVEEGTGLEQAVLMGRAAVEELQEALVRRVWLDADQISVWETADNDQASSLEGKDGISGELAQLVGRVAHALAEVESLTGKRVRLVEEELGKIGSLLEELEVKRSAAEMKARIEEERLQELTSGDLAGRVTGLRTNLAVASRAFQDHSARCEELTDAFERDKHLVKSRNDQAALLTTEIDTIVDDIEEFSRRESMLHAQYAAIQEEIDPLAAEIPSLEVRIGEDEGDETGARAYLHTAERRCAESELEHERMQSQLTALKQQLWDDFSLVDTEPPDTGGEAALSRCDAWVERLDPLEVVPEGLEEEVSRLRGRLRRMGSINTEAVAEYSEVKKRYEHLDTQVVDLESASDHLREVIVELDALMQRDFHQTFEAVAKEFRYTFERLFGGGSAHLELTRPQDLSRSGIEILAQLPGRRQQGLALLSGGERSLTACALVFALLRVSPTPFAMLDEVDAMLDEANVGRFRAMLTEISQTTQFVLITHNRHTVEVADTVYGVSMGTDSASQVISLRLD